MQRMEVLPRGAWANIHHARISFGIIGLLGNSEKHNMKREFLA